MKKEKIDAEIRELEVQNSKMPQMVVPPPPPPTFMRTLEPRIGEKFIRPADAELELDLTVAEMLRELDAENIALAQKIQANGKMKERILRTVLRLNAMPIRHGEKPSLKANTNILTVPQPDVAAQIK